MIDIEDVPKSGKIVLTVFFKGYKEYYQNESRKILKKTIPKCTVPDKVELTPEAFDILKHVEASEDSISFEKTIGVRYSFSYTNMSKNRFRTIVEDIRANLETRPHVRKTWSEYNISIATLVGGI